MVAEQASGGADPSSARSLVRRLHVAGRSDEAIAVLQAAVQADPNSASRWADLGTLLGMLDRYPAAIDALRQARDLGDSSPELLQNLAIVLQSGGRLEEAAQAFAELRERQPDNVEAAIALGKVLAAQSKWPEAEDAFRAGLALQPQSAEIHFLLANVLERSGRIGEAIDAYQRALSIQPGFPEALHNLGWVLQKQVRLDEAVALYRRALELRPDYVDAINSLGCALHQRGEFAEAIAGFEQVIRLAPGHRSAQFNLAISLLVQGELEKGFELFEERWRSLGIAEPALDRPRWDGSPLPGRKILIWAEHGLGDVIQFSRYLPLIQAAGGDVIFRVQGSLRGVLARALPGVRVIELAESPGDLDVHLPLMSLPHVMQTKFGTIPPTLRITADPNLADQWRRRIGRTVGKMNIGLAWAGNPANDHDHLRSVPLRLFAPLAQSVPAQVFSFQKGDAARQSRDPTCGIQAVDLGQDLHDFEDTAAALEAMDLVICVDTALAHLAGSMNKPVWMPVSFVPDWRWLMGREDSPWYPSLRLFRQAKPADWSRPFAQMAAGLEFLAKSAAQGIFHPIL
jgi:Flp pilus assembly protein TadD